MCEFVKGFQKEDGTFIPEGADVMVKLEETGEIIEAKLTKVAKKEFRLLTNGVTRVERVENIKDIN